MACRAPLMPRLYQIDAFTDRPFRGNPAAVVLLQAWPDDDWLQAVAMENNLSETAFLVPLPGGDCDYHIRWFTPRCEVDLCGHATLAAAWVLFHRRGLDQPTVCFDSDSGHLTVTRDRDWLWLDFPARPGQPVRATPELLAPLGIDQAQALLQARDTVVVLPEEAAVRTMNPDFTALARLDTFGVCVTAPGNDDDFVCRFFAPRQGLDEDPVTGSAFCTLAPYWAARLGKPVLTAAQLSSRGGHIHCQVGRDRVAIAGQACCFLEGELSGPGPACG